VRYADVLATHHRLLRTAIQDAQGHVVDTQRDAVFAAFPRARDALPAAIAAQRAVQAHPWPDGIALKVRVGLHTGEPLTGETGYVGMDVHRAARIAAVGHGGQTLLSDTTHALVAKDLPEGIELRDLGEHRLKDLAQPRSREGNLVRGKDV
jgi:class 3 adenylate cyclase